MAAILASVAAVMAGCGLGTGRVDGLAEARDRWSQADVSNYRFELTNLCFCTEEAVGPFVVTVRDGEVVEATREDGPLTDRAPQYLFTVEQMFAQIDEWRGFDEVTATFDAELGFPTEIQADEDGATEDDQFVVTVDDFTVLDG
jgi:hypothetical protein